MGRIEKGSEFSANQDKKGANMEPVAKKNLPTKYVVTLEQCGSVEVYVEGDLSKLKASTPVFLTIHDVGSSYKNWMRFTSQDCLKEAKEKSVFLHVSLPGQQPAADDLDQVFPSMQALGMNLVTVLDHLGVKDRGVVVLGDGAGASIASMFAMYHPHRVYGVVLINRKLKGQKKGIDGVENCALNLKNVKMYEDSYKKRGDWLIRMNVETLMLVGAKSKTGSRNTAVKRSEEMLKQMKKGLCSMINISEVENVLEEAPEEAADAIILFCQGMGFMPVVRRRMVQLKDNNMNMTMSLSAERNISKVSKKEDPTFVSEYLISIYS